MIRNDNTNRANSHDVSCLTEDQRALYRNTRRQLDALIEQLAVVDTALEDFARNPGGDNAAAISLAIADCSWAWSSLADYDGDHAPAEAEAPVNVTKVATPVAAFQSAQELAEEAVAELPWLARTIYQYMVSLNGMMLTRGDLYYQFSAFRSQVVTTTIELLLTQDLIIEVGDVHGHLEINTSYEGNLGIGS